MTRIATRKAQILLSDRQYDLLAECARTTHQSLSHLVRDHLEQTLLKDLDIARRVAAVEELGRMNLPTGDWEEIEDELDKRYDDCNPVDLP